MAHGHAVSGTVAYLAATRAGVGLPDDPGLVAAGVLVTAGAALLPDSDHPGSTLSRSAGLVSQAASAAVSTIAGGHRQLTHSAAILPVVWVAAVWIARRPVAAGWLAGVLVAVAAPLLARSLPRRAGPVGLLGVAPAVWVGAGIAGGTLPAAGWLPVAVTVGVGAHLAGDLATVGGIPLLAPVVKGRVSLGLFRTGGVLEPVVTAALAGVALWLAAPYLSPAVAAGVGEWS